MLTPKDTLVTTASESSAIFENRPRGHIKARTEKPQSYPDRFPVSENITWENLDRSTYRPPDYTSETVIAHDRTLDPANSKLWADPPDPHLSKNAPDFQSHEGKASLDSRGRPQNPMGPTGLEGRGLLGCWGANFAADPIVTRIGPEGKLEMVVIKRKDTGQIAIPGGMVDRGETAKTTLKRELAEETGANLDFETADLVYQGYVDDPRNTDNAWMETDAYHLHLPEGTNLSFQAGDDAGEAKWEVVNGQLLSSLYASHEAEVKRAIFLWQEKSHKIVSQDGTVRDS